MKPLFQTMLTVLKRWLCFAICHYWEYYTERYKCTGIKDYSSIVVPIRECKLCGKRQHHLSPVCNGVYDSWENWYDKSGEVLRFNRLSKWKS